MTAIAPDDIFERARALLSDKLQFVDCPHSGILAETDDKLKFIGHTK